jgi:hypothetical protein
MLVLLMATVERPIVEQILRVCQATHAQVHASRMVRYHSGKLVWMRVVPTANAWGSCVAMRKHASRMPIARLGPVTMVYVHLAATTRQMATNPMSTVVAAVVENVSIRAHAVATLTVTVGCAQQASVPHTSTASETEVKRMLTAEEMLRRSAA